MSDEKLYMYEVTYTDDREGDLRRVERPAASRSAALDLAMQDYHFGRLLDIRELYEITDELPAE